MELPQLNILTRGDSRSNLAEVMRTDRVDLQRVGREVGSIAVLVGEMADVQTMARLITGVHDLRWVTGDGAGGGLYVRNGNREYLIYDWYGRVPAEQVVRRHQFVLDNLSQALDRPQLTVVYLTNYDGKDGYLRVSPNSLLFASELSLQLGNSNLETMTQQATLVRCRQLPIGIDITLDISATKVAKGA